MTLDQLRIFLAVAERRHMTRAAEALGLTQSAVSAAIAALEGAHQLRLFDRVGRGIELSDEGARFLPEARAVLAQAERARIALADLGRATRGRLRIFASQTVAGTWLPPRLMALRGAHPGVEVSLATGNSAQAAQAVREGAADLGFVEGEAPAADLRAQVVAQDRLVLVAAAGHPVLARAAARGLGAAQYRALSWVLREPGSGSRAVFDAHLAGLGLGARDLDVVLELPSNESVAAALRAGGAVAMLSERAVAGAPGLGGAEVDWGPESARPRRNFTLLTHPERHRTRALEAALALFAPGPQG